MIPQINPYSCFPKPTNPMNTHSLRLALCALFLPLALCAADAPAKPAARKPDASLAPVTEMPGLPRVLIIGDSISMGYTLPVRELLQGVANVQRIPQNGGDTGAGLENLDRWLETGSPSGQPAKWDVIHFNWGLHDLKHWKDGKMDIAGPQVSTVEVYEKHLRELVARLQKTGAKLIWCSTTPVPEGSAGRVEGDEAAYNAAAKRIMDEAGIPIDDLAAFVSSRVTELQIPHNVHFTPAGYQALAKQVAESIRGQLKK
jgi:acyl-CoA thioesterase-1